MYKFQCFVAQIKMSRNLFFIKFWLEYFFCQMNVCHAMFYRLNSLKIIIRELKQTDAAAERRRSHSNLHSVKEWMISRAEWIHLALSPSEQKFAFWPPPLGRRVSLLKLPIQISIRLALLFIITRIHIDKKTSKQIKTLTSKPRLLTMLPLFSSTRWKIYKDFLEVPGLRSRGFPLLLHGLQTTALYAEFWKKFEEIELVTNC